MNIASAGQIFRLLAGKVASEIHIAKDELVVLLGALERVMHSWDEVSVFVLIKILCAATVCLSCVSKPLLDFLLARGQVRVHEHEAGVVKVEPECNSSLIGCHALRSCLDLHLLLCSEARLIEAV